VKQVTHVDDDAMWNVHRHHNVANEPTANVSSRTFCTIIQAAS